MIDDYLEYVKYCRGDSLYMARWAMKQRLHLERCYAKGFYDGLQEAYDQVAYDWKALQKDIEAKKDQGMKV